MMGKGWGREERRTAVKHTVCLLPNLHSRSCPLPGVIPCL